MKWHLQSLAVVCVLAANLAPAQEWAPRTAAPPMIVRLRGAALERYVQRTVKASLGPWVDDVEVDVDDPGGRVKVEVELCHPAGLGHLQRLLYALPELAGYQIKIEVDWND